MTVVRKRLVYYVSGFDPRGPSWYYGTYRRDAPKQAALSGMAFEVGRRETPHPNVTAWTVKARAGDEATETRYNFLRWDDVVRGHWPRGTLRLALLAPWNVWRFIRRGVLGRVLATSWPTFICGTLPLAFLLALLFGGLIVGGLLGWLAQALFALPWWSVPLVALAVTGLACAVGIPILDRRFGIHWLSRIYDFNLLQAARLAPDFEQRFDEHARLVAREVKESDADEVLVIGHSTGAQAALTLLARALRLDPDLGRRRAAVSLMTVGGSIPMLSWQPDAAWLREDLRLVAHEPSIGWSDFTLAQDGACFALHDPVESTGIAHPQGAEPKPKLLSVKLFDLFSPEEFKAIRRNWFRVHFQYLMASQQLGDYDYFAITAGPKTLADRFAHRPSARGFDRFQLKLFRRR